MVVLTAAGPPAADAPPPARRVFKNAALGLYFLRRVVDPRKFAELKADIDRNGLLDAPHVAEDGTVLSGTMRVLALRELGVEAVECLVFPGLDTRLKQLAHVRSCDVKSDVARFDQAMRLLAVRRDHPELTQKQVAGALGESETAVSRLCSLLALPDDLVDAVFSDRLLLQHVVSASKVKDREKKAALLRKALADGLTPKEFAQSLKPSKRPAAKAHAMSLAGVTVTWPSDGPWARLDAALTELRAYLRERVKTADVKALELTTLLEAGKPAGAAG